MIIIIIIIIITIKIIIIIIIIIIITVELWRSRNGAENQISLLILLDLVVHVYHKSLNKAPQNKSRNLL